jgi:hypothetical protein
MERSEAERNPGPDMLCNPPDFASLDPGYSEG